jgi:hypothetical protein
VSCDGVCVCPAREGSVPCVMALMEAGADVTTATDNARTPLHW